MARIFGIDLGTTNSLIAVMENGEPHVIADAATGNALLPSVVALAPDGKILVGDEAIAMEPHLNVERDGRVSAVDFPNGEEGAVVRSVKRYMGRGGSELAADDRRRYTFTDVSGPVVRFQVGSRIYTPPQISAEILRALKTRAEAALDNEKVERVVVTVPAYFNDGQRQATKDAGRLAGLEVVRLVNEPTAASLAYGLNQMAEGRVAVYDFGGGTFDISILKLHDGIFEVLATNGDTHLGGDDIDNLLLNIALEDLQSEWGEDFSSNAGLVQLLRRAVIQAKEALSFAPSATIDMDYGPRKYQREIDVQLFNRLIEPIVERTLGPCRNCIKDAGITVEQINETVMVGGSTRIPLVRSAVERLFRKRPHTELNPDEVVALGAAVQAGILGGEVEDKLLLDVTPLSLGIETMGGLMSKLIHRNSTIPA